MNDSLGDRMKGQYEDRFRFHLPRRTYTILRVDGRAFHTWTHGLDEPFDLTLIETFDSVARFLLEVVQGAVFGYLQSDEVSLLLFDAGRKGSEAWFDGNVQKMASVGASIFTARFNKIAEDKFWKEPATFDARVFTVPDPIEVENYFVWRQKDWIRNSVQMLASSVYSHDEMVGKGLPELHEMIHARGHNWADLPLALKNGRVVTREFHSAEPAPVFTKDRGWLRQRIPEHGYEDEAASVQGTT